MTSRRKKTAPADTKSVSERRKSAEIGAGIVVLLKPRYGAYLVAAWLAGIVTNLFSYPAALTLARLASVYDPPLRLRR